MRIAIVGAGRVGRALGSRWSAVGHDIVYGVRDPHDAKVSDLSIAMTVSDAVRGADAILVALPWSAVQATITGLAIGDAILIDATNPLTSDARGMVSDISVSGAELIREWTGSSKVIKAFNTTGSGNMENSSYVAGQIMMPVAGDDMDAKTTVIDLAHQIGFDGIDAGSLDTSGDLEHLAMLWIRLAYPLGNGTDIAFGLLRR